jgi:tetratricopeptide (TPR) repeat protein
VGSVLHALVRRDLIAPDRSAFVGEDAFRFHHLLIQETAYREIPKEARADLHDRFATWLERMAGDRIGEYGEILAYHQEQAARYLSELARSGVRVEGAIDRALASLTSAGRRALARGDMSAAANLLGRAREVLDPADPRRLSIAPDLGEAFMETGDLSRAEDLLTEAVEAHDPGLRAHARIVLLLLKESTDPERRSEEALEVLGSVMPVFEELGDDLGLARSWRLLGDVHWTRAHYAEVDRALERAIEHARRSDAHWEEAESLLRYAGSGLYGPTPIPDVIRRCEQIAAESAGDRAVEAGILRTLGAAHAMQGRIDEGRELVRRAAGILADIGLPIRAAFASEAAGFVETLAGDDAAAERELRAGYETMEKLGERGYLSTVAALLAHSIAAQGRPEEAEAFCDLADEAGAEDDITTQVLWRSARAKVLAARGELGSAEKLVREAVAIAAETDDVNMHADALMDLALLAASGQPVERRDALGRAHDLYAAKGNLVSVERAANELAAIQGSPGEEKRP